MSLFSLVVIITITIVVLGTNVNSVLHYSGDTLHWRYSVCVVGLYLLPIIFLCQYAVVHGTSCTLCRSDWA